MSRACGLPPGRACLPLEGSIPARLGLGKGITVLVAALETERSFQPRDRHPPQRPVHVDSRNLRVVCGRTAWGNLLRGRVGGHVSDRPLITSAACAMHIAASGSRRQAGGCRRGGCRGRGRRRRPRPASGVLAAGGRGSAACGAALLSLPWRVYCKGSGLYGGRGYAVSSVPPESFWGGHLG